MAGKIKLRPPVLSSTISKGILEHKNVAEFEHLFSTLDQIGAIYDGLVVVREATDPMLTREAAAVKYRQQHDSATKRVQTLLSTGMQRIMDRITRIERDAYNKAGIAVPPAEASEIRATLRSMSQKDRDRAIGEAIANGDVAVIASLRNVSPMLVGHTTVPVRELIDLHVDKMVPALRDELADCETALENLEMARQAFEKASNEMRDPKAEADAADGVQKAKLADAQLGLAVQEGSPS